MKSKEGGIVEMEGLVTEVLPGFSFKVKLDNDHIVMASGGGRLRKKRIRISVLDRVLVEMSIHDLTRGRITRRLDSGSYHHQPRHGNRGGRGGGHRR